MPSIVPRKENNLPTSQHNSSGDLQKPEEKSASSQYRKRKQISRIIKHLAQQLPSKISLPDDAVIDQWVHTALRHTYIEGNDWQKLIYHTLQAIHHLNKTSPLHLEQGFMHEPKICTKVNTLLLHLLLSTDTKTMYFR
ncbi:hypothetical protein ACVBE9_08675 [Eionea flava]